MFAILVSAWALAKTQIPEVMFLFYLWDGPDRSDCLDWKNSQKFWKFNSSSSLVIEYWQHELTFALEERLILSKFSSFLLVRWHQTSQLTLLLQKRKVVWWNKTSPWSRCWPLHFLLPLVWCLHFKDNSFCSLLLLLLLLLMLLLLLLSWWVLQEQTEPIGFFQTTTWDCIHRLRSGYEVRGLYEVELVSVGEVAEIGGLFGWELDELSVKALT